MNATTPSARHHVVIVGGGFASLYAAQALKNAPVDVTLIDRRNFHLFQPLLYQVATGGLSPGEIASPLRAILKRQKNTRVWKGAVMTVGLPPRARRGGGLRPVFWVRGDCWNAAGARQAEGRSTASRR